MKRLVATVLLLLLLVACKPPVDGESISGGLPEGTTAEFILEAPARVGPVPVRLELSGTGEVEQVTITGDMTHAGMIPVIREAVEVEPGSWRAGDFEFHMGGDWFLLAEVSLADGTAFEVTLPVNVGGN